MFEPLKHPHDILNKVTYVFKTSQTLVNKYADLQHGCQRTEVMRRGSWLLWLLQPLSDLTDSISSESSTLSRT